MQQPDWAKILSHLHQHNGEIGTEPDESKDDGWSSPEKSREALNDILRDKIDLDNTSDESSTTAWEHLSDNRLITSEIGRHYVGLELTTDGFSVAHERELARKNSRINRSLAVFTLVLVVITGVDVYPTGRVIKGVAIAILLVAVLLAAFRTNTFDL